MYIKRGRAIEKPLDRAGQLKLCMAGSSPRFCVFTSAVNQKFVKVDGSKVTLLWPSASAFSKEVR